jgi:hypothetical protein
MQAETTEQVRKRPPLVCYHQYNDDSDTAELFNKINELKRDKRIKYSHFSKNKIIYFSIPSEHVSDFVKEIKVSKTTHHFKMTYKCDSDEETARKLSEQKDSFVKIRYETNNDEDGNISHDVVFTSKLPKEVHIQASKRIFKSAGIEFEYKNAITPTKKYRTLDDKKEPEESEDNKEEQTQEQVEPEENKVEAQIEVEETTNSTEEDAEAKIKVKTPEKKKRGRPAVRKI